MSTDVDICNLALMKVGAETLAVLDNTSKRSRLCTLLYTPTLERVIKHYSWGFATKRFTLSTPDATAPIYGFSQRFLLPSSILRILELEDTGQAYRVENGYLLVNLEEVNLKAMIVEDDVDLFEDFKEVMALHIAIQLAFPLTQSISLKDSLMRELKDFGADSRGIDSQEGTPESLEPNLIINARFSGLRTNTF